MVLKLKDKDFYRYIYKNGKGYTIMKNNMKFGQYTDLRQALYDRDILEQLDWDIDRFVEYDVDVPNPYNHMELPEYSHKTHNIQVYPAKYQVYCDDVLVATFKYIKDAKVFAELCDGEVKVYPEKYSIYKYINRRKKYFGTFTDYIECVNRRDELIRNNWSL